MLHSANGNASCYRLHCEKKIVAPEKIAEVSRSLKAQKKTIATLNGSFDLLHAGHLEILYQASLQADLLWVALNTDDSIRRYKSPSRPIIPLQYRLEMISALEMVDLVTWFDETDPRNLLEKICPDVHVNGSEYGPNCIEAETVERLGGKIHIVEKIPSLSTSAIFAKILELESKSLPQILS